jgi:hypothetical protein|nr:MAG TPA: hypothetical protein [Caudoviricetes sp.]
MKAYEKYRCYELVPTDGRKSFYGKAHVEINTAGTETLFSYGTAIISRTKDGKLKKLWGGWSQTTGRHIKAFCGLSKKEFEALPYKFTPYDQAQAYSGTLYR